MNSPLPPDPYRALGVAKTATIAEIRSAHRKLVIKCHPDKVQDEALKAAKQEEFHQVQQAYELLSDESKRRRYDEQVKLFDLKRELGRNGLPSASHSGPPPPPPASSSRPFPAGGGASVFDFEVRTAEPRANTFKSKPREPSNIYTQPSPRSFDDIGSGVYDEPPRATARKTASYEERRRTPTREDEKRRKSEEEREQERWEKAAKKSAHGAAKKNRDKERKKGSEEKHSRMAYVVDDDSEEYRPSKPEKKSSRRKEEERAREEYVTRSSEKARHEDLSSSRRFDEKLASAAQYMESTRRKAAGDDDFRPKPMRRAETFQDSSYATRFVPPPSVPYVTVDDEDFARRSSARPPRRASEQTPTRSRELPRRSYSPEPYIVEAAPPSARKPSLQSHTSAPPNIENLHKPHRSKTMQPEYSSKKESTPPPLPRAATFQPGDKKSSSRGSRLKQKVEYSDDSESDSPIYASARGHSPPRRRPDPEPVRYVINNGRAAPLPSRHRSVLREDDYTSPRDRSESPRGTPRRSVGGGDSRPPLSRSSGSFSQRPTSSASRSQYYPSPDGRGEPIVIPVRPKVASRGSSGRNSSSQAPYFGEVKYAPSIRPEDISYSSPESHYRRGSDPTSHHRDYAAYPVPGPRPTREATYA